jgi:hypothetical protein
MEDTALAATKVCLRWSESHRILRPTTASRRAGPDPRDRQASHAGLRVNVIDVRDVAVGMIRAAERGRQVGAILGNWNTTRRS